MAKQEQKTEQGRTTDAERPTYERPRIVRMSEQEILTTFQLTQSMGGWWNPSC